MGLKQRSKKLIRGWFPSTPTMPQHLNKMPKLQRIKISTTPLQPQQEIKFQRVTGIAIGFGIGLMVICFVAASLTYEFYNDATRYLSYQGITTDNYVFRQLLEYTSFFWAFAVGGAFMACLGALSLKSNTFRRATIEKEKHFFGNFAFGFGVGLIVISLRYLFLFFLIPDVATPTHDFRLIIFAVFFVIGAVLFASGILSWRIKK